MNPHPQPHPGGVALDDMTPRRGLAWRGVAVMSIAMLLLGLWPAVSSAQQQDAANGSYIDDDGSVHEPGIEALAAGGVLAGMECGQDMICPSQPLKRWEMAVWMVRVLDGADPASTGTTRFEDVDTQQWWSPFADRLFELGVTVGCSQEPARYCGDRDVSRAQMATFLTRAFDLEAAPAFGFTDVSGGSHGANIDALAAAGVTVGCSQEPLRYCPDRSVNRGQMATFLARAQGTINPPQTPPETTRAFKAVDAGVGYACAIRADDTITCWGNDASGETDPPSGTYKAVSTGLAHTCAIRTDDTIACWGLNNLGQTDAPQGSFKAVRAGLAHTCGLRADDTITCWGNNLNGQTVTPQGTFSAVSAGGWHSCGLRTDGTITCWGANSDGESDPPGDDYYEAIASGPNASCAIEPDGIYCWGLSQGCYEGDSTYCYQGNWLPGDYKAVTRGNNFWCGLTDTGTINCLGLNQYGKATPPSGTFEAISSGWDHSCALDSSGAITCWGNSEWGATDPPTA